MSFPTCCNTKLERIRKSALEHLIMETFLVGFYGGRGPRHTQTHQRGLHHTKHIMLHFFVLPLYVLNVARAL